MPKSKGRNTGSKKRPYVPPPPPKKKPKQSPKWFGFAVVGVMLLGILIIVLNYMNVFGGGYNPTFLFIGLGVVFAGFMMATQLR